MRGRRIALSCLTALLVFGTGHQRAAAQPATIPDSLEQRLLACTACHGKQGEGIRKNEYFPRLAGKPAGYLFNQLQDFRERRRESPIMTYLLGFLSDAYLHEIADHFSKLRPPYPPPATGAPKDRMARGRALTIDGDPSANLPACAACHGKSLTGVEPAIPGLVGLEPNYVAAQMGAWRTGERRARAPDCMHDIATRLSMQDIAAVAAWLAAQPASTDARPVPAGAFKLPMRCGSAP